MCKNSKNILLSAVLAAALCFFVCSEQNAEQTETIPDIVTTLSETTIITGNEIESEAEDGLSERADRRGGFMPVSGRKRTGFRGKTGGASCGGTGGNQPRFG